MKKIILLVSLIGSLVFGISAPALAAAPAATPTSPKESVCEGIGLASNAGHCTRTAGAPTINNTLKLAINVFSLVVGLAAVFAIIFAGFRYITSGGEAAKISSAKDTILYAVVGLIVVALAQFIVKFILGKVTKPTP